MLRSLDTLKSLGLGTLRSSDLGMLRSGLNTSRLSSLSIIRLLDLGIIGTVPVATKVIKRVVTVRGPNKAIVEVIVIEFSLVKAKAIAKIAKTTLKAVIEYGFVVPDLY